MKTIQRLFVTLFLLIAFFAPFHQASATKWIVNVQNFSFSPNNLPNVAVGDTIRWVWVNGSHTTTSTTIPGGAASWDHPINSGNTFYEYPVTVGGNYDYVCTPHAGMGMVGSFTATVLTPTLVSIVPSQAVQGDSFLATITGSNTNFSGNPSVSMSFSNNALEIINASSVTVVSPTVIHAQFTIPPSASPGLWDVHVNSLILDNGFTVVQAVPVLISMIPSQANQGTSITGTITGQYTGWSGTPSVSLSFSGDPSEVIMGTNVVVLNSTHLTADFAIPSDASPGFWNVHVDALVMNNGFTVIEVVPAISFMDPNFAHQGDMFNGTIYGQNTQWSGTPSVYLTYSGDPGEMITGTNVVVVNSTQLTADFSVPADASVGNYTVHVDAISQANGFTVLAALVPALAGIVPDSGEQGIVVSTTITAENTSFEGTEPVVLLSLHANPGEVITGTNVVVINNTSLAADFDLPYDATPGLWDLHVDDLTLENSFTVLEVTPYIESINPDSAEQGQMVTSLVVAESSHFTVEEPLVSLSYSGNPSEVIYAADVQILNDTELNATFDIPTDASVGKWDVHVGSMDLVEGFTVNLLTGIGDHQLKPIAIFPNPAKNSFTVENSGEAYLTIYNLGGEKVTSKHLDGTNNAIDISALLSGVYFVRIQKENSVFTSRLIVQ